MCATHAHVPGDKVVEGCLIAALIQEPLRQMQQLSKEQLPSLAVLPECSSSSAPKAKSCAGKCSNLTARNDGERERNRRFGKDLGREKIRNPYRPYRAASTLGS